MTKFTCVAVIRNQAPYIVEWIAHHLALGVEDFVLCIHGSSDGTARVTRRLAAMGYGAHIKIDVKGDDPSGSALAQIGTLEEVVQADWIALLNVDEFLNIHQGHGRLQELTADLPDAADAITFETFQFGSDGAQDIRATPVTQQFTKRGADPESPGRPAVLARSLAALTAPKSPQKIHAQAAQINQYRCKAQDNLAVNLMTSPDQTPEAITSRWIEADKSDVEDVSIQRYARWFEKYQKMLVSDRRLRLAEAAGLTWHEARAKAARDQNLL